VDWLSEQPAQMRTEARAKRHGKVFMSVDLHVARGATFSSASGQARPRDDVFLCKVRMTSNNEYARKFFIAMVMMSEVG
jgi:hypothetical protein